MYRTRYIGFIIRPKTLRVNLTISIIVCFVIVIYMYLFCAGEETVYLGDDDIDISAYPTLETPLDEEFPIGDSLMTRIPKIIHQTWKDTYVPSQFHNNVRSFVKHNPDFQYYFWSDDSARILIKERHSGLLETFDNYVEPVRKADMLRYVVLYEFGGIYADLDTLCLRPLNRVLHKFSCIISPEPYEHSTLIYNTKFMVTNSIMFCRQKHPFLYQLMYNLPDFSHFSQDIDATGPNYVTLQLNIYNRDLPKTRQEVTCLHDDCVHVPSSQYFQNQIDPIRFDQFRRTCRQFNTLNSIAKSGCVSLKRRGLIRNIGKYEYTKHSFYHTGYKWITPSKVAIYEIVEHVSMYK